MIKILAQAAPRFCPIGVGCGIYAALTIYTPVWLAVKVIE